MYAVGTVLHDVYTRRAEPRSPKYRPTFIRQWREHRHMTLETLAARVGEKIGGMTHASLSRIERGLQPYSQPILEAIAEELTRGDVASLLMRNPGDPEAIWSIWDQAKPGERRIIVDIAKTIVKTGT
jgi:transcriptional regulator with XRE-family HTH domain